jgi:hypothetical protein
MYLFSEQSTATEFLKDVGLLRSKMQCDACGRDMARSADSIFLKDFVGDVKGGLLGSGVISLRPSSKDHGSSNLTPLSGTTLFNTDRVHITIPFLPAPPLRPGTRQSPAIVSFQ